MLEPQLEVVRYAVREAGAAILQRAARLPPRVTGPVDRTVVTEADLEANRILQHHLSGRFPGYGWLSEETKGDGRHLQYERVWIVDPMDGTREYVRKVPEFVVSVALAEKGEVILGVVYCPCTGDLYEATGGGTRRNGLPAACRRQLDGRPEVEVSRSDWEQGRFAGYAAGLELRPVGSIAYKLARLAAGLSDSTLSVTPKNEWDIAAGVCLVTAAGGKVTDLAGRPHRFNQPDSLRPGVIAASAAAYPSVCRAVADLGAHAADSG